MIISTRRKNPQKFPYALFFGLEWETSCSWRNFLLKPYGAAGINFVSWYGTRDGNKQTFVGLPVGNFFSSDARRRYKGKEQK